MSIKPEDILPDDVNTVEINGVTVRKGTVGAIVANAKILALPDASQEEKLSAKKSIQDLIPSLIALDIHKHITWKNPEIQKMVDEAVAKC